MMIPININVRESAYEKILYFLSNFKDDVFIVNKGNEEFEYELDDFKELSNVSLEKVWNNSEDEVYDKFLK